MVFDVKTKEERGRANTFVPWKRNNIYKAQRRKFKAVPVVFHLEDTAKHDDVVAWGMWRRRISRGARPARRT